MKNIQSALREIQSTDIAPKDETNPSIKAYQTIKCEFDGISIKSNENPNIIFPKNVSAGMIALKRKLKRIRESKEH